ncbi:MAG TPA: tetratricopeptide repeat protein [Candidatus Aquicultor sp.]
MLLDKKRVGIVTKIGAVVVSLAFIVVYIPSLLDTLGSNSSNTATNNTGNVSGTITQLEAAAAKNPNKADSWISLGNAYYDANQKDKAIAAYEKGLALDPKNVQAKVDMSISYFSIGQIETATAQALDATKVNPEFAPAYYNLGVFYTAQGRTGEAIKAYEKYIKLDKAGERAADAKNAIDVLKKEQKGTPANSAVAPSIDLNAPVVPSTTKP